MKSVKFSHKVATYGKIIALILIFSMVISAVTTAIGVRWQAREYSNQKSGIIKNENMIVALEMKILDKNLSSLFADVVYLAKTFRLPEIGRASFGNDRLTESWIAFSDSRKIYQQIVFIAPNGQEAIRIRYSSTGSSAVPPSQLDNVADSYYFKKTRLLQDDQIYLSKLDLATTGGEVDLPQDPVLRVSMNVFDDRGIFKGIIVLQYKASTLLRDFIESSNSAQGSIYLLNADGYYLVNRENPSQEFGFMFPGRQNVRFSFDFPSEWEQITEWLEGNLFTENGFYSYTSVQPQNRLAGSNATDGSNPVVSEDIRFFIVSFVPAASKTGIVFGPSLMHLIILTYQKQLWIHIILLVLTAATVLLIVINRQSFRVIQLYSRDSLTGAYTRRSGLDLLGSAYDKAVKNGEAVSLCYVDIDGLKSINDRLGHEVGDDLIQTVSSVFERCLRDADLIVRVGGDEFLLALTEADEPTAEAVWDTIRQEFERINRTGKKEYAISASHGICRIGTAGSETVAEAIKTADRIMYEEKNRMKTLAKKTEEGTPE